MVTLQDIADRAGISVSTVSRVLSGVGSTVPISEATRQKVLQLADELGYYPNVAARALSSKRAGAIGLIIPSGNPQRNYQRFYGLKLREVLAGVELVASEARLNLIIQVADPNFLEDHGIARMLFGRLVDTLILYDVPYIEDIPEDFPTIFLNMRNGNENFVIADDYGGAQRAVEYLVNLGHKHIGFIAGPDNHFVSRERKRGYEAAMAACGLAVDIAEGDLSEESGELEARSLLTGSSQITAIFAACDYMAIGALSAAKKLSLSVPKDLSILGADGMQLTAYTSPAITTIVTALYSMSRLAAGWAIKLLNEEVQGPVHEVFPTEMEEQVMRASTKIDRVFC